MRKGVAMNDFIYGKIYRLKSDVTLSLYNETKTEIEMPAGLRIQFMRIDLTGTIAQCKIVEHSDISKIGMEFFIQSKLLTDL